MNFVQPFTEQALATPGAPALDLGAGRHTSYETLHTWMGQVAQRLTDAGVARGDLVAVVLDARSPARIVIVTLALAAVGAVSVSLPQWPAAGAAQETDPAPGMAPQWVLHDFPHDAAALAGGFKGQIRLKELFDFRPSSPVHAGAADMQAQDAWRINLSSGSTGQPKGIVFAHGPTVRRSRLQTELFPVGPQDRVMLGLGINLGYAITTWSRALYAGACVLLPNTSGTEELYGAIMERGATQLVTSAGHALALASLAAKPGGAPRPSKALRRMIIGGSQVPAHVLETLENLVCPLVTVNYGATETGLVAVLDAAILRAHPGASGRIVPWVQAEAVDDHGQTLPAGEAGLLRFRSPSMASGYAGAVAGDGADAFRDGWFLSQDQGSVADGMVFLSGRSNDVINMLGVKIDPALVERAIAQDTAIQDCAVVVLEDKQGAPLLAAAVVAPQRIDPAALRRRCEATCGSMGVPPVVVHVDAIRRNAMGKIMRNEMREMVTRRLNDRPVV